MTLHGREAEQAAIADLPGSARAGVGATLAILGEAGAGKYALLLEAARRAADDMTTLRTSGIESEAPLPFAALQQVAALLLANTGGNPLALHELASRLTAEQLAGDAPMPPRLPVTERMQRVFLERARRLSRDAQVLLLVASADGSARG